jgi:hypothetical protein
MIDSAGERFPILPRLTDFPAAVGISFCVLLVAILLLVTGKFDPTRGSLTISLMVVLTFVGTVIYCLLFTVPTDEITSSVIGGLVAAFGAVIAFWIGRPHEPPSPPPPKE